MNLDERIVSEAYIFLSCFESLTFNLYHISLFSFTYFYIIIIILLILFTFYIILLFEDTYFSHTYAPLCTVFDNLCSSANSFFCLPLAAFALRFCCCCRRRRRVVVITTCSRSGAATKMRPDKRWQRR